MFNKRLFASDNCSTVHPRVMRALEDVNVGHEISYGDDDISIATQSILRNFFGKNSGSAFVFNGTAANILTVKTLLKSYESVISPINSHLAEDECGAAELIAGVKIEHIPHRLGKISSSDIPACLQRLGFVHSVQPRLLSITQSNEVGQVYSIEEMHAIGKCCSENDLYFHVDGARIANAVASILQSNYANWQELSGKALVRRGREILSAITVDAEVDVISLGGTKNGAMFGEAVIFMNKASQVDDFHFYQKQIAQLGSKMRYISAQFQALFEGELWLTNALQANEMASYLADGLLRLSEERGETAESKATLPSIAYPVQANAVFAGLPKSAAEELQATYRFYEWDANRSPSNSQVQPDKPVRKPTDKLSDKAVVQAEDEPQSESAQSTQTAIYRIMCSWDTEREDIDRFLADLGGRLG